MSVARFLPALLLAGTAAANTIDTIELPRPEGPRSVNFVVPDAKPVTATKKKPAPLRPFVILLHGHSGSAAQLLGQRRTTAPLSPWLAIADRENVLLAAPEGAKGSDDKQGWNDCRADADSNPLTDDVGLVRNIIDLAVTKYRADPARIYAMGMSNGGFMTYRLAIEMPEKLAAVAVVSASMAANSRCPAPTRPMPLLQISGDADPLVPFGGGEVRIWSTRSRGSSLAVEKAVDGWRTLANLPTQPADVTTFDHNEQSGDTSAKRTKWGGDPKQVQIELIVIHNGGHVEPSMSQRIGALYRTVVGHQNADFEAAEEAWSFFKTKSAAH